MKKEKRCPICKGVGSFCLACGGIKPRKDTYSREDMKKLDYRSDLLGQEAIRTMNDKR